MKTTTNNTATNYNELSPVMTTACRWLEQHPRTVSAVIWLELAALVYGVYNYDFTIL